MSEGLKEEFNAVYNQLFKDFEIYKNNDLRKAFRCLKDEAYKIINQVTTLRADLQRVTAERDEYKRLRERKLTDEQIEEAIKRRAAHCKHVDHGQKICVGCALIAIKYEIKRNEAAPLAAVKPETKDDDSLGLNKDFTFTESGQVIDKPIEQKEV
jgi:hypothetical protein